MGATLDEEESLGASKGLQDEDPFEAEIREEKNEEQQALKMGMPYLFTIVLAMCIVT